MEMRHAMKYFRQIWEDIKQGENIDLYVTVPIAIGLAIFNIVGVVPSQLLEPITLIILSLIAISLLGNRNTVKKLAKEITQNTDSVFYREFPSSFKRDIEDSKEVWLVGITLTDTLRNNYAVLKQKLQLGHRIKVMLVHPDSPAIEMAEYRNFRPTDVIRARREAKESLKDLCNLSKVAVVPNNLEIRTIQHPLSYAAFGVNLESSSGTLYISHFAFRMEAGSEPKLVLRMKDGHWYDFYKREIYNMWGLGVEWQIDNKDLEPTNEQ